jgi:carboxyl-terminal processing protease
MKKIIGLLLIMSVARVPTIAQTSSTTNNYFEISKNLELISNIYKELNEYYVVPIEPGKMLKSSMDAMLKELDPYTVYISESEIEDHRLLSAGEYGGLGASIFKMEDGRVVFDAPHQGGPADKVGIKSGDILVTIDGKDVAKLTIEQVGLMFRGAPQTALNIEVKHPVSQQVSRKSIVRERVDIPTITYATLIGNNKDIAYVHLGQFTPNCSMELKRSLDSLKNANQNKLSGVVLDLRDNPGGLLEEAVKICNLFIDKGQIVVTTKGNSADWDKSFATTQAAWDLQIPVTVLINNQSASASEIVAGTIQDLDRGVVIGQRSFGKGLVQVIKNIGYNAKLKITTAKYYTPSGRCIQSADYANKNPDGSAGSIPDSLKQLFKTKKGRSVYDGGGVEPDINIVEGKNTALITSLQSGKVLFDYATAYYYKNKTIATPQEYYFSQSDFEAFKKWLQTQPQSYQTASEKEIEALKKLLQKEKYDNLVQSALVNLEQQVQQHKLTEINNHSKEIISLLNAEIVTRYYYKKGAIENKIAKDDEAISKALEILKHTKKYADILK